MAGFATEGHVLPVVPGSFTFSRSEDFHTANPAGKSHSLASHGLNAHDAARKTISTSAFTYSFRKTPNSHVGASNMLWARVNVDMLAVSPALGVT